MKAKLYYYITKINHHNITTQGLTILIICAFNMLTIFAFN